MMSESFFVPYSNLGIYTCVGVFSIQCHDYRSLFERFNAPDGVFTALVRPLQVSTLAGTVL